MNVIRFQGRPKKGPASVGAEKIIDDALDLLRSGQQFATRKELAFKIGITPALLNYYFGKEPDLTAKPIIELLETYAKRFALAAESYKAVDEILSILVEMYIVDGQLVERHNLSKSARQPDCPISSMKKTLELAIARSIDGEEDPGLLADILWGACSTAKKASNPTLHVKLAKRIIPLTGNMSKAIGRSNSALALLSSMPLASLLSFYSSLTSYAVDTMVGLVSNDTNPLVAIF